MNYLILFITRFISSLIGNLAHFKPFKALNTYIIGLYVEAYGVNLNEIKQPMDSFASIGEFFVRELKPEARPISNADSISLCSPVDGVLRSFGKVNSSDPVLVKGRKFDWNTFLLSSQYFEEFQEGTFFNFYLSPKDYHNVHYPMSGRVLEILHHPGGLLPVNDWSINNFPNLFCFNERVVAYVESKKFNFLMIMIGALNVGSIELAFEPNFRRSFFALNSLSKKIVDSRDSAVADRFGSFRLGSSVICVLPRGVVSSVTVQDGDLIKFGSKIATLS